MRILQRRRFIVSRSQLHLIALHVAYFIVFTLVVAFSLLEPLVAEMGDSSGVEANGEIARVLLYMHARFWPVVGIMIVVAALHSVLVTHRVVGPLVRFRRVFREIAHGRIPTRVVLRKRDYLQEEVEALNEMASSLGERVRGLWACRQRLDLEVRDLERAIDDSGGASPSTAGLRQRLGELHALLDWFAVDDDLPSSLGDVDEPASLVAEADESAVRVGDRS